MTDEGYTREWGSYHPLPEGGVMTNNIQLRPAVMAFAQIMEERLRENDHKSGWLGADVDWLLGRLVEEVSELMLTVADDGTGEAPEDEAADVANFAMMIADVLGGLVYEE